MRFLVIKGKEEVGIINAREVKRVSTSETKEHPTIYNLYLYNDERWGMLILEKGFSLIAEENAAVAR